MGTTSESSNGYGGSNSEIKPEYVYDIPCAIRKLICGQLDALNVWEDLAVNHFGFERSDLQVSKLQLHLIQTVNDLFC